MALREELEASGHWLFRRRSYLPLCLVVPSIFAFSHLDRPLHQQKLELHWDLACLAVSLLGLAVRGLTVAQIPAGTSGRNTAAQRAVSLNTTGMYSVVRHPLYVGNFLAWLGVSMFFLQGWVVAICVLVFWLYYERIIFAEEEFLRRKFGDEFLSWAAVTPAFVPRFSQWRPAKLPFSLRNVLRREYTGWLELAVIFTALNAVEHWWVDRQWMVDPLWATLSLLTLAAYVVLRILNRGTRLLRVEGR